MKKQEIEEVNGGKLNYGFEGMSEMKFLRYLVMLMPVWSRANFLLHPHYAKQIHLIH